MKITKEQLIANCGTKPIFVRKKNGIAAAFPNYCHQRGCERCDRYEASKRKKQIASVLETYHGPVFRAVVDESAWKNMGMRMSKQKIDYFSVSQGDGALLIICAADPYKKKDFGFVEISKIAAVGELSTDRNLFPDGYRSSGGNWRFTEEKEEFTDEIYVYDFIPCFKPTPKLGKITTKFTSTIFAHANTWTKGVVSFDNGNVQEFMRYSMNKAIAMAEAEGARLDIECSRMQYKRVGKEEVDNWSVASTGQTELTIQGDKGPFSGEAYLLQINAIEPYDYIGDYLKLTKETKLREELGDLYDYFYPDGGEYNESEQTGLDKELPY